MKLNLDFSKYKGMTRLRVWWKEVKAHFITVQNAINELDSDIKSEAEIRGKNTDELKQAIHSEAEARASDDADLYVAVSDEAKARCNADRDLLRQIEELAEAVKSRTDCDDIYIALYGIVNQFRDIYRSVGIVMYDGGYASMEYEGGAHLDGGAYGDNPSGVVVDGGDASQRAPVTVSVCSMDKIRGIFDD